MVTAKAQARSTMGKKYGDPSAIVAGLRHFVPFNTLLSIYQSLMFPYLTFGLRAWGQAAQLHLNKLLLL